MQDESTSAAGRVTAHREGAAGIITLDRPRKRNALTFAMWDTIPAALHTLTQDPDVRYIVLRGAQPHFSVGADLREVHGAAADMAQARRFCLAITRALYGVATCGRPTVAAVHGQAIGGALELALAADFRLAAVGAQMQFPFVVLGMVPDPLTLKRLVALVGDPAARRLLLAAEMLPIETCRTLGLVEAVARADGLDAAVASYMAPFCHPAGYVLERSKTLMTGIAHTDLAALAEYRAHSFVHGGVREASARFLARRDTAG